MSFRYIGSKARVVDAIIQHIGEPHGGILVDAFSGAGTVAHAAWNAGWSVLVNDHLASSAIMSFARVISRKDAIFSHFGGYELAVAALDDAEPSEGFMWRQYSPASSRYCPVSRMYFIESNARKIDGIRETIRSWRNGLLITDSEDKLLLADLMRAANRVANTAGTYGCFLSTWQRQSLDALELTPRKLPFDAPTIEDGGRGRPERTM